MSSNSDEITQSTQTTNAIGSNNGVLTSSISNNSVSGSVSSLDGVSSNRFLWALLATQLVVLVVGGGFFISQLKHNSQQSSSINALSSKLDNKVKNLTQQVDALSQLPTSAFPQNLSLQSLTVTDKTSLSQLNVNSIKATSIVADTINGASFPGSSTISSSGLNASSSSISGIQLGSQTTGSYVAELGSLIGLTTTSNSGSGSTPTLSVNYGAGANTSVEGNVSMTCTGAGNNISGGGNVLVLGNGGACSNLSVVDNPSFSSTITDTNSSGPAISLTGTPQGANNASLIQLGSQISGGNVSGTYLGLNESGSSDFINLQNSNITKFKVDSVGNANIAGTFTVNGSGDNTNAGVLLQNSSNSTTAVQIRQSVSSGGLVVFNVDTSSKRVGINTSTPADALDVNGYVNASAFLVGGHVVCDSGGCAAGTGSGSYIQNGTGGPQLANFDIQSNDGSAVTAKIAMNASQSTDVFEIVASDNTTVIDKFDSTGALTVVSATVRGTLTVNNNLSLNGHIITGNVSGGGSTSAVPDTNAGVGSSIGTFNGNDTSGTAIVTTVGAASGYVIDITFKTSYTSSSVPHCVVSADDSGSAAIEPYCVATNNGIKIGSHVGATSGTYTFDYIVAQ